MVASQDRFFIKSDLLKNIFIKKYIFAIMIAARHLFNNEPSFVKAKNFDFIGVHPLLRNKKIEKSY